MAKAKAKKAAKKTAQVKKSKAPKVAKAKATPATSRARKAAKTAAREKVTNIRKPGPKAQDLPGMEDRAIKPLEEIAVAYAEIRDQRIALNKEEKSLKDSARRLMHKYGKTVYKHDGVEIRLVPGEEDVKVKVKDAGDDDDAPAERTKGAPADIGDARDAGAAEDAGDAGDAGEPAGAEFGAGDTDVNE